MTFKALVSCTALALGLASAPAVRAEDTSTVSSYSGCKKLKGANRTACTKCLSSGEGFFNKVNGKWQCGGDLGGTTVAATRKGDPWPKALKAMPAQQKSYVTIPAGTFHIGTPPPPDSSRGLGEYDSDVKLTRSFSMKTTEVTEGEWYFVMKTMPERYKTGSLDVPVHNVTWLQVVAYMNALSKLEKLEACYVIKGETVTWKGLDCEGYRLPTEAEWEFAARGGSKDALYGSMDEIAWHGDNSDSKRHPVGTKKANAYGLHDMVGNVAEWTWDEYKENAFEQPQTDPVIGGFEMTDIYADRGYRGGGFMMPPGGATVAGRNMYSDPNMFGDTVGFRPVRTVKAKK